MTGKSKQKTKTCDSYCRGCKYHNTTIAVTGYCTYRLYHDYGRGCGAGEGCTRKEKGKLNWGKLPQHQE